jgi:cell division protein ZapA
MGMVEFSLGGRSHSVQCGEGEEVRLKHLAAYLDTKYQEVADQHGQIPDSKALLLISLLVADELSDAYDEINRLNRDGGHAAGGQRPVNGQADAAASLERVAERIEQLATAIENA